MQRRGLFSHLSLEQVRPLKRPEIRAGQFPVDEDDSDSDSEYELEEVLATAHEINDSPTDSDSDDDKPPFSILSAEMEKFHFSDSDNEPSDEGSLEDLIMDVISGSPNLMALVRTSSSDDALSAPSEMPQNLSESDRFVQRMISEGFHDSEWNEAKHCVTIHFPPLAPEPIFEKLKYLVGIGVFPGFEVEISTFKNIYLMHLAAPFAKKAPVVPQQQPVETRQRSEPIHHRFPPKSIVRQPEHLVTKSYFVQIPDVPRSLTLGYNLGVNREAYHALPERSREELDAKKAERIKWFFT